MLLRFCSLRAATTRRSREHGQHHRAVSEGRRRQHQDASASDGKDGGKLVFGQEQEFTSYNNSSSHNGLVANIIPLNLVQPQPFITDGHLDQLLNTELMKSVTITSKSPMVVEWVVQPSAVWEDGAPIDCEDFYLTWLAQNGKAKSSREGRQWQAEAAVPRGVHDRL